MRESDFIFEDRGVYVIKERYPDGNVYTVYRPSPSGTHAVSDSSYAASVNGMSLAKARAKYLAGRAAK